MDPKDVREFVARRWDLVEREKGRVLEERFRREGSKMGLGVLAELRQRLHTRGVHPYFEESRADDLAEHLGWVAKLARVRDGLARR